MPITVVSPTTGQPWGWGFLVILNSDVVPPVGETVRWHFRLRFRPPLEGEIFVDTQPYAGPGPATFYAGESKDGVQKIIPTPDGTWVNGGEAEIAVQLRTTQQEILAQTVVPVIHDTTTGMAHLLQTSDVAEAGFTAQDRLNLETTMQGIGYGIGGGWSDALGNLLTSLGRRIFNDVLIVPDRSGQGRLIKPSGNIDVDAFGIQWQLVFAPDGFGIDEGVPDRTEIDYMQLSYMYDSEIGLVPRDSRYVADLNGRWLWGMDTPDALDYFIMPGVLVRFWWIVIAPGAPLTNTWSLDRAE